MEQQTQTFDIEQANAAQARFCQDNAYPHFAPHGGKCYDCGANIYEDIDHGPIIGHKGISVESAGLSHITGCPHCYHSFCE